MNKWLNFGGDPDPYRNTGKTCLGEGMHCPSVSSSNCHYHFEVESLYYTMLLSPSKVKTAPRWGKGTPSLWFFVPTWVHNVNSILINTPVFERLTIVIGRQMDTGQAQLCSIGRGSIQCTNRNQNLHIYKIFTLMMAWHGRWVDVSCKNVWTDRVAIWHVDSRGP